MFYYERKYYSSSIGSRLVEVTCDRCGCEYLYELARVGAGSASAPFAIGGAGAASSASEASRRELLRRLAEEAELVPCPGCLWINDDLIAGHRLGRFRGWGRAAAWLGIVGTAGSLIVAWFLRIGAPADRGALPLVLAGGPAGSIAVAASILVLRRVLRARIRPNRDHPLPPKLPPGSPEALVRDRTTGEVRRASSVVGAGDGPGAWLEFQVGRSDLPATCCRCLAPGDPRASYRIPLGPALNLAVPLCRPCARLWTGRKWLGALVALGAAAAVGLPVLLASKLDEILFWPIVGVGAILAPVVGAMVAGSLASPARVKSFDASRGVVRLWFRNEEFPKRVAGGPRGLPPRP